MFVLTAGRRSCLERAVPAEIVRSCAWRQKKEPRNIWKGNLDSSNQHSCLGVGNIINIVLIAIYVKRKKIKKIKKVVDIIYSNDYYVYINETAKGGHHVKLLFHRR